MFTGNFSNANNILYLGPSTGLCNVKTNSREGFKQYALLRALQIMKGVSPVWRLKLLKSEASYGVERIQRPHGSGTKMEINTSISSSYSSSFYSSAGMSLGLY